MKYFILKRVLEFESLFWKMEDKFGAWVTNTRTVRFVLLSYIVWVIIFLIWISITLIMKMI